MLKAGPLGRRETERPYDKMKIKDVTEELRAQDPPGWQDCKDSKEREQLLKGVLKGVVRKPALLYQNNLILDDIPSYEISPSEPLHDLKGHISNLWAIFSLCRI